MPYLDRLTGIKRCGKAGCTETDPTKFGKCRTWPDGLAHICLACARERVGEWQKANKEAVHRRNAKWEKANRDKVNARKRRLKKTSARIKATTEAYKERANELHRLAYLKPGRKAKRRAMADAWIAANPEKKAAQGERRRALRKGLPATWAYGTWPACKKHFADCCAYCGKGETKLEKDHFIPMSKRLLADGTRRPGHVPWNVLPACTACNRNKLDREPFAWLRKTSRLDCLPKILDYLDRMRKQHEQVAA